MPAEASSEYGVVGAPLIILKLYLTILGTEFLKYMPVITNSHKIPGIIVVNNFDISLSYYDVSYKVKLIRKPYFK